MSAPGDGVQEAEMTVLQAKDVNGFAPKQVQLGDAGVLLCMTAAWTTSWAESLPDAGALAKANRKTSSRRWNASVQALEAFFPGGWNASFQALAGFLPGAGSFLDI